MLGTAALTLFVYTRRDSPQDPPAVEASTPDPAVNELVERGGWETNTVFLKRLEAIAERTGWREDLAKRARVDGFRDFTEAQAVAVGSGRDRHVVVLLKSSMYSFPGIQTALLLDEQGRYLDHVSCEISNRLVVMNSGRLFAVLSDTPQADGAHLVVRLDGVAVEGNFAHVVEHGEANTKFYWGDERRGPGQPNAWEMKGLCRVAITGRKFKVIFPGDEERLRQAAPRRGE